MKKKLLSDNFLYGVIVLAMLNNLEHSAEVYHDVMRSTLPDTLRWIIAVLAVCIIDLSILAFVVRKKHILAAAYGAGMFAVNIVYHFYAIPDLLADAIASIVFSLMTTHSIYAFSKMLAEKDEEIITRKMESGRLNAALNFDQKVKKPSKARMSKVKKQKSIKDGQKNYLCHVDGCNYAGKTHQALNAHMRMHTEEEKEQHEAASLNP